MMTYTEAEKELRGYWLNSIQDSPRFIREHLHHVREGIEKLIYPKVIERLIMGSCIIPGFGVDNSVEVALLQFEEWKKLFLQVLSEIKSGINFMTLEQYEKMLERRKIFPCFYPEFARESFKQLIHAHIQVLIAPKTTIPMPIGGGGWSWETTEVKILPMNDWEDLYLQVLATISECAQAEWASVNPA